MLAATLSLTVILTFTGMLGQGSAFIGCEQRASQRELGRRRRSRGRNGLRMKANGRTTEQTGKCGRQGEGVCGVLHIEDTFPSGVSQIEYTWLTLMDVDPRIEGPQMEMAPEP